MKRVLFLTYHFPPEGGPAVQRVLKFVKYLPCFGYEPIVLTSLHPIKVQDPDLLADIPSSIRVYRILDPFAWLPFAFRKWFGGNRIPDRHITWKHFVLRKAEKILQKEKIDLLFSSSPPHSIQVIAKALASQYNLPWIADFRDEWTRDSYFSPNAQISKLEKETLQACQAITTVTLAARKNFLDITNSTVPVYFLPNGYDPEDFEERILLKTKKSHKLNITYCGRFTKKSSPHPFFEGLRDVLSQEPFWKLHLHIRVIGGTKNSRVMTLFPELKPIVEFIPYQPHNRALALMQEADVLLLLSTGKPGSEIPTGKVYEYMASQKPILAIVSHQGELSEMLSHYGNAYLAILSEEGAVSRTLREIFQNWKNGKLEKSIQLQWVEQFDRKKQTAALAKIFDSVLGKREHE